MNIDMVSDVLCMPVSWVRRLVRDGKLPGSIVNGRYIFSEDAIVPFIPVYYSDVIKNRMVSEQIFVCPSCGRVWDVMYLQGVFVSNYYDDFPTYGHKRIICKECEDGTR